MVNNKEKINAIPTTIENPKQPEKPKKKSYWWFWIAGFLMGALSPILSYYLYTAFVKDDKKDLSGKEHLIILIMAIPFWIILLLLNNAYGLEISFGSYILLIILFGTITYFKNKK